MLFDSSLRKDLARNFVATVVVLCTIVMTMLLIRTLGQASRGSINPSDVLVYMGLALFSQLATVLGLSLFIAVMTTFSRMYADSEMVIWNSSGLGPLRFVPVVLRFAWPIALAIALLALVAWPWSNQQLQDLRYRHQNRGDVERIAPGQFQESAGGNRVFFIDKEAPGQGEGSNVFISTQQGSQQSLTIANQGRIEQRGSDRFIALERGEQWLLDKGSDTARQTVFERYALLIDAAAVGGDPQSATRVLSVVQLLRQPSAANLGELSWRLGLVFSALNLALLALPLSAFNPRMGRSYQSAMALLCFVIYYNLINVGQNAMTRGTLGFAAWMLGLHGAVTALALLWTWRRHANWSVRRLLPTRKAVA